MKNFYIKLMKNKTARYILTAASYVFLTVLFFGIGYSIGTETGSGLISTPVSVASPAEENTPAPTPAPTPNAASGYRLIIENGELRLYSDVGDAPELLTSAAVNEALFPKSDIDSLRSGLTFRTLEEALQMMENFLS